MPGEKFAPEGELTGYLRGSLEEEEPGADFEMRDEIRNEQLYAGKEDPVGHSFYVVGQHSHNLDNVRSLLERYPDEYAARMRGSCVKPDGLREDDDSWLWNSWAWHVLRGILSANEAGHLETICGEDVLGLPDEFLELPAIREKLIGWLDRGDVPEEVKRYLEKTFRIKREKAPASESPGPVRGDRFGRFKPWRKTKMARVGKSRKNHG